MGDKTGKGGVDLEEFIEMMKYGVDQKVKKFLKLLVWLIPLNYKEKIKMFGLNESELKDLKK